MVKNPPANTGEARDVNLIPGSGRSLGVGNDNPLQHYCVENSMDRGAWWAIGHGDHKELDATEHAHMMYRKIQESGLTEIISLMYTLAN